MRMIQNPVDWATDRLFEEYPNLADLRQDVPDKTPRDFVKARLMWGIKRDFTLFQMDGYGVYGVLLLRPVTRDMVYGSTDYWKEVFDFDPRGDVCFVDFAYGHGLYPVFIKACKLTRRPWICYRHKNKLRMVRMDKMPDR